MRKEFGSMGGVDVPTDRYYGRRPSAHWFFVHRQRSDEGGLSRVRLREEGSSIMPSKVNPTQCDAIVTIATQVPGDNNGVAFVRSQGNIELNAVRPIIISTSRPSCA
jgi:fumarate hydratase class II